jgi:predicted DNA-binding transcriptional regulator YafY
MYGSKDEKWKRLEKIAALVTLGPRCLTQAALARLLGVAPSTIANDLATLERLGVRLAEDEYGRLALTTRQSEGWVKR